MSTERAQMVTDVLLPRQKGDNDHLFVFKTTAWWPEILHTSVSLRKASARTTHSASTSTWGQWNTEEEFNEESNHRLREQKWELVFSSRQDSQIALFNFLLILEHVSIVTPRTGEPHEARWRLGSQKTSDGGPDFILISSLTISVFTNWSAPERLWDWTLLCKKINKIKEEKKDTQWSLFHKPEWELSPALGHRSYTWRYRGSYLQNLSTNYLQSSEADYPQSSMP